jgi:hypothetical protein
LWVPGDLWILAAQDACEVRRSSRRLDNLATHGYTACCMALTAMMYPIQLARSDVGSGINKARIEGMLTRCSLNSKEDA